MSDPKVEANGVERFPQPAPGSRDWYAFEAIRALPRIILMVDKNRFSDTYGCFDREYWHYRTVDFPCAMNQEFCLPLALAYKYAFPNNPYRGKDRLKELVVAAIDFARRSTHSDGSCDDYFPYERALGANVFSTYALAESYLELQLDNEGFVDLFRLRGDWLIRNNESGQLANHQAFAALALFNVYLITGERRFRSASDEFRDLVLSWQHEEGWFQEYEGADPGYHTCTLSFLGKLWQKSGDESLVEPANRAVEFASYFMHPDGSYGGEYGSRNTYHFYPHGFEVWAKVSPTAAWIADKYLKRSLPERRRYYNDDNRMCAHYVYDWMHAWRDHTEPKAGSGKRAEPFEKWFPGAGLLVKQTDSYYAVTALNKGGVLKVFDEQGPLYSDTGMMVRTRQGDVLVTHLVDPNHSFEYQGRSGRAEVQGSFSRRRQPLATPAKQILFRLMNLTLGRIAPDLVRRVLQKVLITGKQRTSLTFRRKMDFHDDRIEVTDEIDPAGFRDDISEIAIGSDATSIYVANSNTFQESVLLPWTDLSGLWRPDTKASPVRFPTRTIAVRGAPPF